MTPLTPAALSLDDMTPRVAALWEAFAATTREHQAAGDADFTGEFLTRDEDDWLREFAAWATYCVLQEETTS